ncbi:MAG: biotin/lipoate A/B protein ligase family protein [Candidatus Bathyarchaeota archaeon]|nr:biotin/lipoate A/B protein ligase family protein [Candidatus Bathyarchaeota archaeon]
MSNHVGRVVSDSPRNAFLGLAVDHSLLLLHPHNGNVATLRFWSNPRSVIVGRGQSLKLEVNRDFCRKNGILVCRRISGGGAVYQDEGNLNVSLIYPRHALERPNDVREATRLLPSLIKKSLEDCGLAGLTIDDLNGVYLDGYKVSGAASYLSRDAVLAHSTLLVSANLENLEGSLVHSDGTQRRRSRYAPTRNLPALPMDAWRSSLVQLLEERFDASFKQDVLTPEETRMAERLSETMYSTEGWIRAGERPDPTP